MHGIGISDVSPVNLCLSPRLARSPPTQACDCEWFAAISKYVAERPSCTCDASRGAEGLLAALKR